LCGGLDDRHHLLELVLGVVAAGRVSFWEGEGGGGGREGGEPSTILSKQPQATTTAPRTTVTTTTTTSTTTTTLTDLKLGVDRSWVWEGEGPPSDEDDPPIEAAPINSIILLPLPLSCTS